MSNTQKFIIKFFPEIMVKGAKAKRQMVNQLFVNLQKILGEISKEISITKFYDKIEVVCPVEVLVQTRQKLLETPGIELVLEAIQFDDIKTIDEIKVKVNETCSSVIKNKTFKVEVKRVGEQNFKSPEIARVVGGYMLAQNKEFTKGVDVVNPEVIVKIELIHTQLNIITQRYKGLGGFPIGTQGAVLSLMSGGFDSTVASYLTMSRGLKTNFVFFNLGGTAHEIGVKQVAYYLWKRFGTSHRVTITTIPFEDVVSEIFRSTNESYMGVTLKRLMLQASEKIANSMKIDALITGESVAQVSSQTLRNLALIDKACNMLVLRPLATMSKPDIMEMASKIGTKKFAETMPEYCGVISKNPVTHGNYEKMEIESKKFDYSVLENAVNNAVTVNVDEIDEDVAKIGELEVVSSLEDENYVVIDIRQGNECIKTQVETLKIPFYDLKKEFKKLPQDKQYLFYCEKGILSQLHGQYLRDSENFKNIKVYRPNQ